MKLENQVCSLESAKKLRELGVKQESLFYWFDDRIVGFYEDLCMEIHDCMASESPCGGMYPNEKLANDLKDEDVNMCSAFTVAELGELCANYTTFMKTLKGTWLVRWTDTTQYDFGATKYHQEVADTEADARAKMLIYLIENKLIQI